LWSVKGKEGKNNILSSVERWSGESFAGFSFVILEWGWNNQVREPGLGFILFQIEYLRVNICPNLAKQSTVPFGLNAKKTNLETD